MSRASPLILLALSTALLAGCGKKPSFVDAPAGVKPDPFPRTYPNPASEGGPSGRVYPTPESDGQAQAPMPSLPPASADPFARIYRNPGDLRP
jgi:hypothetical protein